MADLYGVGCSLCNKEVAAALERMPKMDGYLDAQGFFEIDRLAPVRSDGTALHVYLDGEDYLGKQVEATVPGDDGWLIRFVDGKYGPSICSCQMKEMAREVWRGKVEIR